jgi:hypothetical protein
MDNESRLKGDETEVTGQERTEDPENLNAPEVYSRWNLVA